MSSLSDLFIGWTSKEHTQRADLGKTGSKYSGKHIVIYSTEVRE